MMKKKKKKKKKNYNYNHNASRQANNNYILVFTTPGIEQKQEYYYSSVKSSQVKSSQVISILPFHHIRSPSHQNPISILPSPSHPISPPSHHSNRDYNTQSTNLFLFIIQKKVRIVLVKTKQPECIMQVQ
jgi:hypothetical protein